MPKVSALLRALMPAPDAEEPAYRESFGKIADLLLNGIELRAAGVPHRFTEVEFYYKGRKHVDKFTHGDPMQKQFCSWYFHRTAGEYRGGTYKGLDLAIGDDEAHGGILLRGAERIDSAPAYLDGPCVFVDHVLKLNGKSEVAQLADSFDRSADAPDSGESPLYLVPSEGPPRGKTVYRTPRVGLTLKRGSGTDRQRFVARLYRYVTEPLLTKKGKLHFIVGQHHEGRPVSEIAKLAGVREAVAKGYIEAFEKGKERPLADFTSDLSTEDTCGLFGFCSAHL